MDNTTSLQNEGYIQARTLTQQYAASFYFASHLLTPAMRRASYAVYAICRKSDDTVDDSYQNATVKQARIELMRSRIQRAYAQEITDDPLLAEFRHAVTSYAIPQSYFDELMQGMLLDTTQTRYETFEDLYDYCYKVAGVVGLMMLHIFGFSDIRAKEYAVALGVAMQLTNILRDVKEDAGWGRIYLARNDLTKHGVCDDDIQHARTNKGMIRLIQEYIAKARSYYDASKAGIPLIVSRRGRLTTCCMRELYAGILTLIEENGCDIFRQRLWVSTARKTAIAGRVILSREYL